MKSYQLSLVAVGFGCLLVIAALLVTESPLLSFAQAEPTPERTTKPAWVYGNEDAPITIVEFSDFECPFCARAHPTLKRLVDESDGQVKWEFRHLPLPIHRLAKPTAILAECVGEIGGNETFWQFIDAIFADQAILSNLMPLATQLTGDEAALTACIKNPAVAAVVDLDSETASAYGGTGTPFSLVSQPDGTWKPVTGALPYEYWQPFIKQ